MLSSSSKLGTNKRQTCSSFCTVTDIIFAVFGSPGKSALRCPKPTFPDRHRVRHLHSMCRNNDPGIRCPQQAVRKLCVWGITLFFLLFFFFSFFYFFMLGIIAECSFHLKEFKHVILLQEHARKALDVLWERRQRGSDLVGTVINIHNGEWVRRGEAV